MTDHSHPPGTHAAIRRITRVAAFFITILLAGAAFTAWVAWERASSLPKTPVEQSSKLRAD